MSEEIKVSSDIHALCKHEILRRDTKIAALEAVLDGILTRYLNLVLSGDCGNWNPEKEAEVIAARAAINSTKGDK